MNLRLRDRVLSLSQTCLMGILNLTPDSFSDGGLYFSPDQAVRRAEELAREGADLLDLGAESTRPGARPVTAEEEMRRLLPVLIRLKDKLDIPLSIDTTKPEVAETGLRNGAHLINDVSGLKDSGREMAQAVKKYGAGLVLMHRRGNPRTMQSLTQYGDVAGEVIRELAESVEIALEEGLRPDQIVIDPGLGFAKTAEQNVEILNRLEEFHALGFPILLGPSRKSFLGKLTGRETEEREFATAAVAAFAVFKGIQMLRVHEIAPMRDVVRVAEAIRGEQHVRTF